MPSSSMIQHLVSTLNYRNPTQTKNDILALTEQYDNLRPKSGEFTFNHGLVRKLINLDGTIPVVYRNVTYNIPIVVWILDTYPLNAPICYVRPTAEMEIRVSRHVDSEGKIYLPYLHQWSRDKSDLLALVQVCIITFSEQPPLYTKSKTSPQQQQQQQQQLPYPANYNFPGMSGSFFPSQPPAAQPPASSALPYPPMPGYGYPSLTPAAPASAGTITEEHIRASLLTAVEEKLRRALREEFEYKRAEMQSLTKMRDELETGKSRLTATLRRIDGDNESLENSIGELKGKITEMDALKSDLEVTKELDVDEAVMTTAPLYKQLLNAFSEEASIDDAIYYLGEGLRRGVIDCDTFLKHVRKISRKQFILRSIMIQCREKAGLPL